MRTFLFFLCLGLQISFLSAQTWISARAAEDSPNLWQAFRHGFEVDKGELGDYGISLAADSKYWLYVNGELVVREGGLKRGPYHNAYYVDTFNLAPWLVEGKNTIGILLWYFGKQSFSHQSSEFPGLWLAGPAAIESGPAWKAIIHPAFGNTAPPRPNYRLPESNIAFDATKYDDGWKAADYDDSNWPPVRSHALHPKPPGEVPFPLTPHQRQRQIELPGHRGELRPIPQWVNGPLSDFETPYAKGPVAVGDTLKLALPHNAQVTPYFRIDAEEAGLKIEVLTDNLFGGGPPNVRTVYYTRKGVQSFETPGWMNGHEVWFVVPEKITILDLRYRESGFATDFMPPFKSDDPDLDLLWKKAQRTLYLTMRDTYMDCPDRERAQWWGDVVNELGETVYALDRDSDQLTQKAIRELMHWQRADSTIYSPVPAGSWDQELPMQMLASVGHYGIWHYYWNTGDRALISEVYPAVKRYLDAWETLPNGLVKPRKGGWTWGDWGKNRDFPILFNGWYYLALQGLRDMAELEGDAAKMAATDQKMEALRAAFNPNFWNGNSYRSADYDLETDERGHALAVVSGLATPAQYPAILKVFKTQEHASPYMEKYVLEALCKMGEEEYALTRMKKRFRKMIDSDYTTLFEGWGIGKEGYGGGTYNHAWSGGALTIMNEFVAGAVATSAGWATYRLQPGGFPTLKQASAKFESPRGPVSLAWVWGAEGLEITHEAQYPVPYVDLLLPIGMEARGNNKAGRRIAFTKRGTVDGKQVWRTEANAFTCFAR